MRPLVQDLIESLRDELKEYGEMLALLDQTQPPLAWVTAIHSQAAAIAAAREQREYCRRRLATRLGLPETASWRVLLPRFAAEHRPLIQALVQENHELFLRVQLRTRQHNQLLHRITEIMDRSVGSLTGEPEDAPVI